MLAYIKELGETQAQAAHNGELGYVDSKIDKNHQQFIRNKKKELSRHSEQLQQIEQEVRAFFDAEASVFGPTYDRLNARLLARKDQDLTIVDPELAAFKEEKQKLENQMRDEIYHAQLTPEGIADKELL